MSAERINPLSPEHCDTLDAVICSAAATADLIARCKACGLRVEAAEAENTEQMRLARSILDQFRQPTQ